MDERAKADLARSGITIEQAEQAYMFDVPDAARLYPFSAKEFKHLPALVIPYYDVDGQPVTFERDGAEHHFARVRYLAAPDDAPGFFKTKELRYGQPKASGVRAYFPRAAGMSWREVVDNTDQAIVITEGEKKALATTLAGFATIGLGGVYNFLNSETGDLIPELDAIAWRKRDVWIAFDSDASLNPNIQGAEARLVDALMRQRGANVMLARLPMDGDRKVGLDDFLLKWGAARLQSLLEASPPLGTVDAAVVALNKHVAWVERDGLVYDLAARHFIHKDNFAKGSRFSSLKVIKTVQSGRNPGTREVSVASEWLTHAHAQRYQDLLFRPGEPETLTTEEGGTALNVWHGWESEEGDIAPFMELSEFLFSKLPAEHQDLPLKLMAYKAQNPAEKVPLAIVLIGQQGCGKSLWGECIREAFAPYGVELASSSINDTFQGWLERSLIAIINEADAEDLIQGHDRLKALISDMTRPMNEKYRVARQIRTYTMYVLTSNSRRVGAYSADDRRMIVIDCPTKREWEFYHRVSEWKRAGGAKRLLHWLLNYDLKGWLPPPSAPMTAEKHMAYMESLTPAQRLAVDMQTAGEHTLLMYFDAAVQWAEQAITSNDGRASRQAQEIIDSVPHFQVRPWYTPEEIAMLFPAVVSTLHGNRKMRATVSGEISRELREAGVPYLECADDPRGFKWKGATRQFLVVSNQQDWSTPLSQSEFERAMAQWPRYGEVRQKIATLRKRT